MTSWPRNTPEDAPPRPQKRQVLADGVHDALVALLMSGRVAPGDPVGIDSLSRDFDVSPTPIREALARIETTGLIVREPLRGYRVAPVMSADEFCQLTEARLLIEPYNAAAACRRRSGQMGAELNQALARMKQAPTGPTYQEFRLYLEADAEFHAIISRYAGNHFLTEALTRLGAHQHRFRLFGDAGVTDAPLAIKEHEAILAAIESGPPDEARRAMKRHIQNVFQRAICDSPLAGQVPERSPITVRKP